METKILNDILERYNYLIGELRKEIAHATSSYYIAHIYEFIGEAKGLLNLLCDNLPIKEYIERLHELNQMQQQEDEFLFNFFKKEMNQEENLKDWRAVFNHLRGTNLE